MFHVEIFLSDLALMGATCLPWLSTSLIAKSARIASYPALGGQPSIILKSSESGQQSVSPHKSHASGSADAVAFAAVGVADGELVVGIGVEADVGVHPHAHATAQLQAIGLLR